MPEITPEVLAGMFLKEGVSFRAGDTKAYHPAFRAGICLARVLSLSLQPWISSELLSGCKTCPVGEDRHFFPSNAFVFHVRMPLGKHLCKLKCVGGQDQNA